MLKLNVKFISILFLLFILNSTAVFADSYLQTLRQQVSTLTTKKTNLQIKQQEQQKEIENLKKEIENLKKEIEYLKKHKESNLELYQRMFNFMTKECAQKQREIDKLNQTINEQQKEINELKQTIDKLKQTIKELEEKSKPTSIYFTGKDRVWKWHPSFDYASITIHHRVKIHTRPSIYAPVRGWTEHEDIFISIGDIQSGPGSIRGWGRPVSYKDTKDGWINLDQLNDKNNLLWCIGQYDGTVIEYWHWENGVTKFHDEAYCVDPR